MEHEIAGQAVKAAMDGALVGTADRKKEPMTGKKALKAMERVMNALFFICGMVAVAFVLLISIYLIISAMAVTGAYYDVPMGEVQKPGKVRDTFIGLSTESAELGRKLGVEFPEDPISYNLKVIDKLDPESTASMQKDLARGHDSEIQGLLFDMITAAEEQGIDIPTYRMVAEKFTKH